MPASILTETEENLKRAQAKITYIGEQSKPIGTVAFHTEGYDFAMDRFEKANPPAKVYPNDPLPYTALFVVKPAELRRIGLAVEPLLSKEGVAAGGEFLAFSIIRAVENGYTGQEFRIGASSAKEFYQRLLGALEPTNRAGHAVLTKQANSVLP